ncbi:MAG: CRTAC1 family protein, partial [Bacteroidetes bacterium]|nr:CRTAC1 family protein [Bacteroidota bacterium]
MNKFCFVGLFCFLSGLFSCKKHTLFQQISSSHSGIHFNNQIIESDSINPLDVTNIYNGGGVGVGDFNNDGLQDLYFTGNMVSNRLYLNKGNFEFEDITEKAGVGGMGRWGRGVAIVDINNDGLMDIYVCNTIYRDSSKRRNLLYINQGIDKDGIPHFREMAKEYGLDLTEQSTMASFFDYDNDGDLDMYLTVNSASSSINPNLFGPKNQTQSRSMGKLCRNDWDEKLHHPVFHDVSAQAGINIEGFGHGATTVDINNDGWKDIYVSDDFVSNNILYINNHDGTFTDRSKEYFKHTSYNAMGQDIVDINNDGLPDVVELDMNPQDNYRKKMILGANSYQTFQFFDLFGTQYQYVRNTLQINQGPRLGQQGHIGSPAFGEIGFLSGISQTDWSWTPLVVDFNNDGYRDLIVTNGFPKDVSDHDFVTYRHDAYFTTAKQKVLDQIPQIKIHNYAYQNNGNLTFQDVTQAWGLTVPTFSNGAVYADLDNDGAMDVVINNINDEALVYRNTARDDKKNLNNVHYLQIGFKGGKHNINGLGASVDIYYDHGKHQTYENDPYRGYLSSMQAMAHFGLGKV